MYLKNNTAQLSLYEEHPNYVLIFPAYLGNCSYFSYPTIAKSDFLFWTAFSNMQS